MKRICVIFCFCCVTFINVFSQQQQIDSLKLLLLSEENHEEWFKLIKQLNNLYIDNRDLKKEDSIYNLILASKKVNHQQELYATIGKADVYKLQSLYPEAIEQLKVALGLTNIKTNNNRQKIEILINLAECYKFDNDKEKALHRIQEAIELSNLKNLVELYNEALFLQGNIYAFFDDIEKSNILFLKVLDQESSSESLIQKTISNIGMNYLELGSHDKAIDYFEKNISFYQEIKDTLRLINTKRNIALALSRKKVKLDYALKLQKEVLNYFKSRNKLYTIDSYANIGATYCRRGDHNRSMEYAELALNLSKEVNSEIGIVNSAYNIANELIELEKYYRADILLKKLITDSLNLRKGTELKVYENLGITSKELGNYKVAYQFVYQSKKLSDSIYQSYIDSKIPEIETKFQTEKKEKENLQLKQQTTEQELELEKENKRKWLLAIGLITSLLAFTVFGFFYRRNKKQKQLIESLQKELHHRIKNNLAIIDTFIETTKDDLKDSSTKEKLAQLQNRIESIHQVHQQLHSNSDVTHLYAEPYIKTLIKHVQSTFPNSNAKVQLDIHPNLQLQADVSFQVGLIINEFLTNSYKYAFGDKHQHGNILICLTKENNLQTLSLSDNGKGLPNDFNLEALDTFGIDIMQLLTKQLKGTFSISSENGVSVIIKFPKKQH